jgi:hypothetical protein
MLPAPTVPLSTDPAIPGGASWSFSADRGRELATIARLTPARPAPDGLADAYLTAIGCEAAGRLFTKYAMRERE